MMRLRSVGGAIGGKELGGATVVVSCKGALMMKNVLKLWMILMLICFTDFKPVIGNYSRIQGW